MRRSWRGTSSLPAPGTRRSAPSRRCMKRRMGRAPRGGESKAKPRTRTKTSRRAKPRKEKPQKAKQRKAKVKPKPLSRKMTTTKMKTRTTSSNPFSPGLADDERAALLNGRVVVLETSDGIICSHHVIAFHKYLPRGDLSHGGHREKNLI